MVPTSGSGIDAGTYTKQSADTEAAIVREAVAAGINFIDTAEGYGSGEAERAISAAIKGAGVAREDLVIASKVNNGNLAPVALREACERSLSNLGTSYIDLYQIHLPERGEWDVKATFGEFKRLQVSLA